MQELFITIPHASTDRASSTIISRVLDAISWTMQVNWHYRAHSDTLVTVWGRGDLQRLKKRVAIGLPTRHTLKLASTRLAHARHTPPVMVDSTVPWAPPLASNPVAWPATALGSSPKPIDFDKPSMIAGLALPRVPLRLYASIPTPSRVQSTNLRAIQTSYTPQSAPALHCERSHSLRRLS